MENEYQEQKSKQPGWFGYRALAIIAIGVSAFAAYWMNHPTVERFTQPIEPCSCEVRILTEQEYSEEYHYFDTPVDYPVCDEEINHEWFYVEPSLYNYLSGEDIALLTAKWEGGKAMDP